ncbi:nitrilase-related carbon-nitrogen hydrolase [Streptomyces sp. NPDC093105]|uniref:nitrilase-related carbon-nitrogen hydrolase n=1 Tax=Streptomyces sp. NPDC093105 TaxID=3366029 RepID=UPI00380CEDB2
MRVVLIQAEVDHRPPFAERVAAMGEAVVSHAARHRAGLVLLPELWATGFFNFDDYARTAEPLTGPAVRALGAAARAASVHLHAGSLVERGEEGRLHNTSLLFGPDGGLLHSYRKVHLFGHRSRESALLSAGTTVRCADSALGRLGLSACYDLRFPELYRALVDDGARVLLVTAAWPAGRIAHWRLLVQARAVENQAWVVAGNAAGAHAGVRAGGGSLVVDPWGRVVAEAGPEAAVLVADVDPALADRTRAEFPALADRRIPVRPPD